MAGFKRAVTLQLVGTLGVLFLLAWLARYFDLIHIIVHMQKKVGQMEIWGGVLYVPLYALCNLLLLPGSVLTLGSGLCFGLWWGFFLSLMGNVLGAAVAFVASRKFGRGWVEQKFLQHKKWRALDEAISEQGWKIIFLSQVHPLFPTSLLNYLYGITRMRFWPCMLWIALGQTPGIFLYTYLGTLMQLGIKVAEGKNHPHPIEYVVWIGGLALSIAVATGLGRVALKLMREIEKAGKQPEPVKKEAPVLEKSTF